MEEELGNYFQGNLSYKERMELMRSIEKDKGLKEEFLRLQNINALIGLSLHDKDEKEGEMAYINFLKKETG